MSNGTPISCATSCKRRGLVSVAIDEVTEWFLSRSYSDPEDFLATQLPQGTIDGVIREYVAWGRDWLTLKDS